MSDIRPVTNQVDLVGKLEREFVFSHYTFDEKYYTNRIKTIRANNVIDYVPVIISEKLIPHDACKGTLVTISGNLRVHTNKQTWAKELFVFVKTLSICPSTNVTLPLSKNFVFLSGCICRAPLYRKLPFDRHVTLLTISVDRNYGFADFVPCIVLQKDALYCSYFEIGTPVQIHGLIQSRNTQRYEVLVEKIVEI